MDPHDTSTRIPEALVLLLSLIGWLASRLSRPDRRRFRATGLASLWGVSAADDAVGAESGGTASE